MYNNVHKKSFLFIPNPFYKTYTFSDKSLYKINISNPGSLTENPITPKKIIKNKIKLNFIFIFFLILVVTIILVLIKFTFNSNIKAGIYNRNRDAIEDLNYISENLTEYLNISDKSIPFNNMKHAILLLSSYGIDYLNNFLAQFNNDKRFDIYIHLDGKSKMDVDNHSKIIISNIKYLGHIKNPKRFSIEMVDVMYELLIIANKSHYYDYYHFLSESCYLVKSLNKFYNFFVKNNLNSYLEYGIDKYFLYKKRSNFLYKGSQWMSLHNNIVKKLINNKELYEKYKAELKNKIIQTKKGAPDECIFHNIIIRDICMGIRKNYNIINNNLRFIKWRKGENSPIYLDVDNVSEDEINYIKSKMLIIRKIDYKNPKGIKLINKAMINKYI